MSNISLLANPPTDDGTYSGGSWTLPLTNLKTQQPTQVARSTDVTSGSTQFKVNLGAVSPTSMFALIATNLTVGATVRLRVSNNADGSSPSLDVTIPAYGGSFVWGDLEWGEFQWEGTSASTAASGDITFYKHTSTVNGQYVLVDIVDTSNTDGYVQIGRFMAGEAIVPTVNFDWGAGLGFIDDSKVSRTVGGQLWFDVRQRRRRFQCNFDWLTEAEAYGAIYDLQQALGLSGNLLLVYNPDDSDDIVLRRTIYGTMVSLDDIVTARFASDDVMYSWRLAVEELL